MPIPNLHKALNVSCNFMGTFQIKASSLSTYLATLFTILFSGIGIGIALVPTKGNPPIALAVTILVIGCAMYATHYAATAKTQWTITETEIQLQWINQFLFQNNPDLTINWSEIRQYKYRPDQYFDLFKIELNDGKIIKLRHNTFTTKDDFKTFLSDFETKVHLYNQRNANTSTDITRAKTIYETKLGVVLAMLTALCLIAIPILIIILPHRRQSNWGLIAAFSAGIFFITQVLIYRKKKSSS